MHNQSGVKRLPTVAIVGPGALGTSLAATLSRADYEIRSIGVRPARRGGRLARALAGQVNARLVEIGKQPLEADVVWIAVPDDAIARVARILARSQEWQGRIVFHSSGALTSDELAPLRARGARVASVHPMMTFVRGAAPQMAGVSFALEGDSAAVRTARAIVESLDATAFVIRKQDKVLYHVFGSFASPLVLALMATLEQVALAAGIRNGDIKSIMVPLLWQTLRNYLKQDAAAAFSGPLVRGDVATVRKHLVALRQLPHAREVYIALVRAALQSLPVKNRRSMQRALKSAH